MEHAEEHPLYCSCKLWPPPPRCAAPVTYIVRGEGTPRPPAFTPPTPSYLVNFNHEPEPTDIKVHSCAMKEGVTSLIFTGQGVLSRLAGCIPGCHLPHKGGKVHIKWSAHVFHMRSLLSFVRQGQCGSFIADAVALFPSLSYYASSSSWVVSV
jgi:hypothetical protein